MVIICFGYFFEEVELKGKFYEGGIMIMYLFVILCKLMEYGGFFEMGVFYFVVFVVFYLW